MNNGEQEWDEYLSSPIEVGDLVRVINTGSPQRGYVGEVYALRPGMHTGRMVYSVKFEVPGKNRMHGFYYEEEIEHAES